MNTPKSNHAAKTAPLPDSNRLAAELRGFGPRGIIAILLILAGNLLLAPLGAILVLVWARLSYTPWHEIGYVRPKNIIRDVTTGIVFGTIFAFTGSIFLPMVAHAAFDLAAVAIIYWDIESRVAHLVFR